MPDRVCLLETGGSSVAKRRFDEFKPGRVLGVGTVGTIYEAYDTINGVHVALKCFDLSRVGSRDRQVVPAHTVGRRGGRDRSVKRRTTGQDLQQRHVVPAVGAAMKPAIRSK